MTRAIGLLLAIAGLSVGLLAWQFSRQHRALLDAQRGTEQAKLALAHQIVASDESKQELQADIDGLLDKNAELAQAVAEARAVAPSARPVAFANLKTQAVEIQAPPGPPMPPECQPNEILAPDGMGTFYCKPQAGVAPEPPSKAQPACALAAGSQVSFDVDQVVLKTFQGASLLVGTAALWRESPEPRAKLAQAKFSATLSDTSALAPPPAPRWGAELDGACARSGCGLGVSVLFPPLAFWGVRLEARAGALLGPDAAALGAIGLRF